MYEDRSRKLIKPMVFDADEKRNVESFQMLKNLFEMIHIDNMKVLKALIYAKDDILPLIDGSSKKRVRSSTISSIYVIHLLEKVSQTPF